MTKKKKVTQKMRRRHAADRISGGITKARLKQARKTVEGNPPKSK